MSVRILWPVFFFFLLWLLCTDVWGNVGQSYTINVYIQKVLRYFLFMVMQIVHAHLEYNSNNVLALLWLPMLMIAIPVTQYLYKMNTLLSSPFVTAWLMWLGFIKTYIVWEYFHEENFYRKHLSRISVSRISGDQGSLIYLLYMICCCVNQFIHIS